MGEIRFVGTGETRGYPYLVCKKRSVGPGKTRGFPYLVYKKRIVSPGKTRGYPYTVCKKILIHIRLTVTKITKVTRICSYNFEKGVETIRLNS